MCGGWNLRSESAIELHNKGKWDSFRFCHQSCALRPQKKPVVSVLDDTLEGPTAPFAQPGNSWKAIGNPHKTKNADRYN